MQKVDRDSNWLAIRTHYVLAQLEPLQIMLLSANIGLGYSQGKNLDVHVVIIRLNQDNIFFMNVLDSMATGIQEETLIVISSCFWSWTQMHFLIFFSFLSFFLM